MMRIYKYFRSKNLCTLRILPFFPFPPFEMLSKVKIFKPEELNVDDLVKKAEQILRKKPFNWQLEAAKAILVGNDVILDVGTGSGKTLCFSLPLLANENDISLTISPLSALMIDQVCNFCLIHSFAALDTVKKAKTADIPTVPICAELLAKEGADKIYKV